ncbi:hypothetical protein N3K66_004150 [Trichothecium roseum]|uniref:Uncharacterized protein n=1 Tax=Trichothecium roseum TaxID=47278 RepID=A0ACC0V0G1_9HYPO|nr:hypothetical protein N3K66_004150 [Trichothecium roseum]
MAEQEQQPHSLASTFPSPPPFWRDFTPENVRRIDDLLLLAAAGAAAAGQGDGSGGDDRLARAELPEELVNLQPPPEPADGRWRVFGDHYSLNDELPTLEDQGITNLPATHPSRQNQQQQQPPSGSSAAAPRTVAQQDTALELKRLVKSLLLNFLELAGALHASPGDATAKVADLRTLLINIHHTLNEYRPHQARESAAELMQDLLDRTRRETAGVQEVVDRGRRVLEGLGSLGVDGDGVGSAAAAAAAGSMAATATATTAASSAAVTGEGVGEEGEMGAMRERDLWSITDGLLA